MTKPYSSHRFIANCFNVGNLKMEVKRIKSSEIATDLDISSEDRFEPYVPRGTDLEMDVDVVRSYGIDIDLVIHAEIDECIAYADALRDRGIDVRVIVKVVDRDNETGTRGSIEVRVDRVTPLVTANDIPEPTQEEGAVERDQGHKIVATGQQSTDMLERIGELERDNMRLKDMMDVMSQRVTRSQRRELRVQRELRQIWRFRFYDCIRIARHEACARRHLGQCLTYDLEHRGHVKNLTTKSTADWQEHWELMTLPETLNPSWELEEMEKEETKMEKMEMEIEELEMVMGTEEEMAITSEDLPARESTYQDFLKCQPLSFNGIEGVVGLTRWFEKMETVFHISNCPEKYQVKIVPNEEDKVDRFVGGLPDNIQESVIVVEPTKLQDAIRIANNLMDQKLKGYARSAENKKRLCWELHFPDLVLLVLVSTASTSVSTGSIVSMVSSKLVLLPYIS
uniref:Reverse transcriptase domain-containing protein n=1 Tax=Tanacetum cinerariifolium TaxID=118510 RepID=A0A6L2NDR3_TANCI|nr:reverse transcriptase domain-containing protein [Tanacetum cinerariifolium]